MKFYWKFMKLSDQHFAKIPGQFPEAERSQGGKIPKSWVLKAPFHNPAGPVSVIMLVRNRRKFHKIMWKISEKTLDFMKTHQNSENLLKFCEWSGAKDYQSERCCQELSKACSVPTCLLYTSDAADE